MREFLFAASSRLTDALPVLGARLLDHAVRPVTGSRALSAIFARRNRAIMRRVRHARRFLVIADSHIGDAVLSQSALTAIRDYFPDAAIDYVVNRTAAALIEGNPEATRVIPLFASTHFPSAEEVDAVRRLVQRGSYDLCLVLSPFLTQEELAGPDQPLVSILSHAADMVRNDGDPRCVNHLAHQQYHFVRSLLALIARPVRGGVFRGVRTTYDDEAIAHAAAFSDDAGISEGAPVVMLNPDAASVFNMMPFASQSALLEGIARNTPSETVVLLGAGHTAKGIGQRLLESLPSALRQGVRIIPPGMPLAAYAALIDRADVFVTGDTGPLHLAASRRYARSGNHQFRNATAIQSCFGATMPRMSGYDSEQPGYIPSNQDAPSWCYQAGSRCRNITCLNKMMKTCRTVRCFERVDVHALVHRISTYVDDCAKHATAASAPAIRFADAEPDEVSAPGCGARVQLSRRFGWSGEPVSP
jgi:ADP-heptose:LPS heptosyltransferase